MTAPLPRQRDGGAGISTPPPGELTATIAALLGAQRRLVARPRATVLAALDDAVDAWLAPSSRWLDDAVAILPEATGFSAAMIRQALPTMLEPLRAPHLADLVAAEAGTRCGPPLIVHILPGNVVGLAAIPAALSLSIGSAALLKPGSGDRLFPSLFCASIAARDPELAACIAAPYWPSEDRARTDAALAAADLVVAAGADATVADLSRRACRRFIGHGHRLSLAVVGGAFADHPPSAAALAFDTALWDQRGCLSPQLCFVEGDRDAATAFAAHLAGALGRLATSLPPGRLLLGDRLAIRRLRDESEWGTFDGERATVFAAADEAAGTIVVEPRPGVRPSPLGRSLRVMPIASIDALEPLLAPHRAVLEGAGLMVEDERWGPLAARLRAWGVHLVSPIGQMQRPPLGWRQGGRPRLADWVAGDAA